MYCRQCGKEMRESKFCPYCGAKQDASDSQQTQYDQPIYEQTAQSTHFVASDDESSLGFALLSFFIPIVGLVLFIVWNKDYPKKAKSCLKGLITGIVLYVVVWCCVFSSVFSAIAGDGNTQSELFGTQDYDSGLYYNTIIQVIPNK